MRYVIRERLFRLGEDSQITDEQGQTVFEVDGKVLTLRDRLILREQLEAGLTQGEAQALIIRTLPNGEGKMRLQHSGTNPPYLHHEAVEYLVQCGIEHLLLDLPSVDREVDGGALLAHRAFWQYPHRVEARQHCTITELIYVPDAVRDGYYLLNLQTAAFDLDASPSRPVIFELT